MFSDEMDKIRAAGRDEIAAAMRRRGHVPGDVRTFRTTRGTWYSLTRCANRSATLQCATEAEYSVERSRVTASTVAHWCQYETADQKIDRRAETGPHYHVERNGETESWAWIFELRETAQRIAIRHNKARRGGRYTVRRHVGPCPVFREYLTNWPDAEPVATEV